MTIVMKWQMTYLIRTIMTNIFQRQGKRRGNKGTATDEIGENIWHSNSGVSMSGQGVADLNFMFRKIYQAVKPTDISVHNLQLLFQRPPTFKKSLGKHGLRFSV